ncbi:zinc finger E-box-binding homeobox 2 isoform X3 [Oryzias latipes]
MYCKSSDSQNSLEDLSHFGILAHLRKASTSASIWDHLNHNGEADVYRSSRHDDLPPAIWSPGAQQCSPEGADSGQVQQRCPFCHRMFLRGASLRDHVKFCQDRDGGPMVCPLCGYTSTFSSHMERHLLLHNQLQDKVRHKASITFDQGMDNRKFKCLQCGKAFKYKHHLKEHLRIHSGEKPYQCSNCKKRFSHSGSYSSHLSSKKCLSGGGHVGLNASGLLNGHSQNSYPHSHSTSPSAGKSSDDSVLASQNQESTRAMGQATTDPQQMLLQDLKPNTTSLISTSSMSRSWSPSPELPPRASFLKGNTLLPFFHSGTRFEQMLQGVLHRDTDKDMDKEKVEDRNGVYNGGGHEKKVSPERSKEAVRSSDGETSLFGVICRWCLQLFPNMAVLLQHERYLCKNNREAVEVSDGFQRKDQSSPPMFFPRSSFQPEKNKPSEVLNGFSGKKSPIEKPSWHSVPQQLLVASAPSSNPLSSHMYWSSQERGSPRRLMHRSPEEASPRSRRRVPSGLSSPACLDLTSCPPQISPPQKDFVSSWSAQNEPLDLSLPKRLSEKRWSNKTLNGVSVRGERFGRLGSVSHLTLGQGSVFSGAPAFPGSLYNGFPMFSQPGVGLSVHDGASPFSQTANCTGFQSPLAYMLKVDAEAAWKKILQEGQGLMSETLNRGDLDYLSLIDDGLEGEGGPGRKRLKKTDEGLYACDICDKTFQKSSSLLRHKYEHTGKRPHECKICHKAFKHKHHLIEHSRLHSGEKPYQCDKCGKRFSHSGSYSQHMNHRYAYCSKDQDLDQDQEEMLLTPGAGGLARETSLSMDDTPTGHSFLSDSSLDGAVDALKEEEDEEEVGVSEALVNLSEAASDLGGSPTQRSLIAESGAQIEKNDLNVRNREYKRGSDTWDKSTENQNKDMDEMSSNAKDLLQTHM